jgi:hypothetical protein
MPSLSNLLVELSGGSYLYLARLYDTQDGLRPVVHNVGSSQW